MVAGTPLPKEYREENVDLVVKVREEDTCGDLVVTVREEDTCKWQTGERW